MSVLYRPAVPGRDTTSKSIVPSSGSLWPGLKVLTQTSMSATVSLTSKVDLSNPNKTSVGQNSDVKDLTFTLRLSKSSA